jgi:hypothetical protein
MRRCVLCRALIADGWSEDSVQNYCNAYWFAWVDGHEQGGRAGGLRALFHNLREEFDEDQGVLAARRAVKYAKLIKGEWL